MHPEAFVRSWPVPATMLKKEGGRVRNIQLSNIDGADEYETSSRMTALSAIEEGK